MRRSALAWLSLVAAAAALSAPRAAAVKSRPLLFGSRRATALGERRILRPVRRIRKGLPSGRWLLEYADLRPLDESSPECQIFLATNIVFFAAGGALVGSSPALALQLELAGMASVWYHYTQCCYGGTQHPSVQLAILIDYIFAVPTALRTLVLVLGLGGAVPPSALLAGVGSFAALAAGWVWDGPRAYMALHGAWHLLGALCVYEVAIAAAG